MNIYRGSNAPILLTFDEVVSGWPLWDICILDGNGCIELKLDENSISFPEPNKVLILLKQSISHNPRVSSPSFLNNLKRA